MALQTWIALVSVIIALGALGMTILAKRASEAQAWASRLDGMTATIGMMQLDIGIMKTQIAVFWRDVAYTTAIALHSPHAPTLDVLLEAFQEEGLSSGGREQLVTMLKAIVNDASEVAWRQKMAKDLLALMLLHRPEGVSDAE